MGFARRCPRKSREKFGCFIFVLGIRAPLFFSAAKQSSSGQQEFYSKFPAGNLLHPNAFMGILDKLRDEFPQESGKACAGR